MDEPAFDPAAPLAPPPDPWRPSEQPSPRSGPPFHMTDMIAAEPHLARRLLARLGVPGSSAERVASALRAAIGSGLPIVLTGCGTSEHAALGAASVLRWALSASGVPPGPGAISVQPAFELSLAPPADAIVIGISHEGGTAATNAALQACRLVGCRTALITAAAGSPGAALADIVVATEECDRSWCHTVGYVSPLLAATAIAAQLAGQRAEPDRVARLMADAAAQAADLEAIAARLAGTDRLLVIASGVDRASGRELELKVEEGAWLPASYRDLETLLHGHLAAADEGTGLVLLLTDQDALERRAVRARQALAAAATLGHAAAAILSPDAEALVPADLTPVGRAVLPAAADVPPPVGSLLAGAIALQLLAERLARARGTNPDAIHRDDPRQAEAAEAARAPR